MKEIEEIESLLKSIIRLIAGFGIFLYGLSHEEYKNAIPSFWLRLFVSILIWTLFFTLIKITDVNSK